MLYYSLTSNSYTFQPIGIKDLMASLDASPFPVKMKMKTIQKNGSTTHSPSAYGSTPGSMFTTSRLKHRPQHSHTLSPRQSSLQFNPILLHQHNQFSITQSPTIHTP